MQVGYLLRLMFNFFLKLGCLLLFGLILRKAISLCLRERGKSLAGILFYLGYVMPRWFERILIRFELNQRILEQILWLTGYISEYYNRMAPVSPTRLEHTLKGFCKFLGMRKSKIDLIVKASYLINVGTLYYDKDEQKLSLKYAAPVWNTDFLSDRNVEV